MANKISWVFLTKSPNGLFISFLSLFVFPFHNVYVKEPSLLLKWKTEYFKALFLTSNRITLKSENVVYLH